MHRVSDLPDEDWILIDGIPVTSLARTFVDLSPVVRDEQIERMIDAAERQGVFDLHAFDGRALPRRLRKAFDAYCDLGFTRSDLERFATKRSTPCGRSRRWRS